MKTLRSAFTGDIRQFTMVGALVTLILAFQVMSDGRMLTSSNVQNLLAGNAYVLILAIGMVMVIVIGQIDLSVGSVAGFVGMSAALSITQLGFPWWAGMILGLVVGIGIGAWQGFWLAKIGIPGFITTLAGMMIFRGGVIWLSGSISVPVPDQFSYLGSGYLPEWGPTFTQMNNSTLMLGVFAIIWYGWSQYRQYTTLKQTDETVPSVAPYVVRFLLVGALLAYATWLFGSGRPGTSFPVPGLILVVLVIVYHIITQRTRFGRAIYAVGGNRAAAALAGVNTQRTYFLVMLNMSFLAALAGILFVGRATAAGPSDGTMWELDAIAAVFIGGAAVSGGIGTVAGSIVGGLVMAVLNSGLSLMGVGADKTQVIKGLVLLAAVAFDIYNKQQGRPSIIGRFTMRRDPDPDPSPEGTAALPGTAGTSSPTEATTTVGAGGTTTATSHGEASRATNPT